MERLERARLRFVHWLTLRRAERQNNLHTRFCRLPTQLDVLAGDVVDFLRVGQGDRGGADIRIVMFGCSIGAEPYSIASVLRSRRPDLAVRMECFDVEPAVIARAQAAEYSRQELDTSPPPTSSFVAATFDEVGAGGRVVVKRAIADSVRFAIGDMLDASFVRRLERADVVIAQNVLYHLPRRDVPRAFANLVSLMKPRSALLIDGTDLDVRTRLTKAAGLRPCSAHLERIHNEARISRGYAWPGVYWGLEPFDPHRADAARRFATIFLSDR